MSEVPDDLPPPDLKDSTGRMRRIVISLLVAGAAALVAYPIATKLVKPETEAPTMYVSSRQMDGGTFVVYVTLIVFASVLAGALALQNYLAKRKWREDMVPRAKVR